MPENINYIPTNIAGNSFSPVDYSKWNTDNSGLSPKAKSTWDLIFRAIKELGLPALAIIKGSGAARSENEILTDPTNVSNNVSTNDSTIAALTAALAMKERNAPTNNWSGFNIDFSSPTTYLVAGGIGTLLYLALKK